MCAVYVGFTEEFTNKSRTDMYFELGILLISSLSIAVERFLTYEGLYIYN